MNKKNLDVDKLIKENDALKSRIEFLQGLIDSQVDLIFSKTKDGRFFICNQSFADHRGTTKEAIVGKNDYDFSPKELADGYIERDNKVMKG